MLVVSPVTLLMKDQVESFGSEVSKGIKYNEEANAGPSPNGPFFVFYASKVPERTAKQTGSRFLGRRRMLQKPSMGRG